MFCPAEASKPAPVISGGQIPKRKISIACVFHKALHVHTCTDNIDYSKETYSRDPAWL